MAQDSFIRWQKTAIEQMGFAVNTLMALAAATIGFCLSLIFDGKICCCCARLNISIGILLLILCIAVLLIQTVNRLIDYRMTAKIARKKEGNPSEDVSELRNKSKLLGRWTWCLFYCSIGLFFTGYVFLFIGFYISIL